MSGALPRVAISRKRMKKNDVRRSAASGNFEKKDEEK
jgi:hypothetical protein